MPQGNLLSEKTWKRRARKRTPSSSDEFFTVRGLRGRRDPAARCASAGSVLKRNIVLVGDGCFAKNRDTNSLQKWLRISRHALTGVYLESICQSSYNTHSLVTQCYKTLAVSTSSWFVIFSESRLLRAWVPGVRVHSERSVSRCLALGLHRLHHAAISCGRKVILMR